MKTRQEMIYDFMLAMAPSWQQIQSDLLSTQEAAPVEEVAEIIFENASALTNSYLEIFE